ncbi:Oxygen regulatory protein NreC [Phycisphaerales bacterium]|nr:Oxygen regulatory protein NreC [Phycisphaerales bacterium]
MTMASFSSREVSSTKPRGFQPPRESAFIWDALTQDTNVSVIILDSAGIIEFANDRAVESFKLKSKEGCIGKSIAEYLPADLIRDRMNLAKECLASGKALTIEGMTNGVLLHCTFRPVPGGRVMSVSHLAAPNDPMSAKTEPGVVKAQVQDPGSLSVLTTREMEILKLIGLGLSSAEIARRLDRSVKTVEWHRVSLGDKLGVTNRVELARIAIGAGLVGVDQPRTANGAPSNN